MQTAINKRPFCLDRQLEIARIAAQTDTLINGCGQNRIPVVIGIIRVVKVLLGA
jgi:hypothetical protein